MSYNRKGDQVAFFSDTFSIPLIGTSSAVKEVVVLEGEGNDYPSIFIYLYDKKFFHISLRNHTTINQGQLKGELATNFKYFPLKDTPYITYMMQYEMQFLDLSTKSMVNNLFKIQVPTYDMLTLDDFTKEKVQNNSFYYECFYQKEVIAVCEVYDCYDLKDCPEAIKSNDSQSTLVVCSFFRFDSPQSFQYTFTAFCKQMCLQKLDDYKIVGYFHNYFTPHKGKLDFVIHTQDISNLTLEGHKTLSIQLKEESCVLFAKLVGKDRERLNLLLIGNDKFCPFVRLFQILPAKNNIIQTRNLLSIELQEQIQGVFTQVIRADDEYVLVEKITEKGNSIQSIRYKRREIAFQKQIQHLKNPNQKENFWLQDQDLPEMLFFYKDYFYVQTIFNWSNKTLVFLDDNNSYSPKTEQININDSQIINEDDPNASPPLNSVKYKFNKSYELSLHMQRLTKPQLLNLFLMDQKNLKETYPDTVLKNCIEMLKYQPTQKE